MSESEWDVFISYASEDREEVVEPLVKMLSAFGVRVWYDRERLQVGQRLTEEIDAGLSRCAYGIVILSPSFLPKHFPNRELDGLLQREVEGERVLLPVWHGLDEHEIRRFSPPLANRVAARTSSGLLDVTQRLLKVLRPTLEEDLQKAAKEFNLSQLPEVTTGSDIVTLLQGALAYNFGNAELKDNLETELVGGFLQSLNEWGEILGDLEPLDRLRTERRLGEQLKEVRDAGWRVYGALVRQVPRGYDTEEWPIATVLLTRGEARSVHVSKDGRFIVETPPGNA